MNLKIKNSIVQIDYRNAFYNGQLNNNIRYGFGILITDDSSIFVAHWQNNELSGPYCFFSSKIKAYGQMKQKKMYGFNVIQIEGKKTIYGNYQNGLIHGLGIVISQQSCTINNYQRGIYINTLESHSYNKETKQILLRENFSENYYDPQDFLSRLLHNSDLIQNINNCKRIQLGKKQSYYGFCDYQGNANGLGLIFKNGIISSLGQFKNNKLNGLGRLYVNRDQFYDGYFKNGILMGSGVKYNNSSNTFLFGNFNVQNPKWEKRFGYPNRQIIEVRKYEHLHSSNFVNQTIVPSLLLKLNLKVLNIKINENEFPQQNYSNKTQFDIINKLSQNVKNQEYLQTTRKIFKPNNSKVFPVVYTPKANKFQYLKFNSDEQKTQLKNKSISNPQQHISNSIKKPFIYINTDLPQFSYQNQAHKALNRNRYIKAQQNTKETLSQASQMAINQMNIKLNKFEKFFKKLEQKNNIFENNLKKIETQLLKQNKQIDLLNQNNNLYQNKWIDHTRNIQKQQKIVNSLQEDKKKQQKLNYQIINEIKQQKQILNQHDFYHQHLKKQISQFRTTNYQHKLILNNIKQKQFETAKRIHEVKEQINNQYKIINKTSQANKKIQRRTKIIEDFLYQQEKLTSINNKLLQKEQFQTQFKSFIVLRSPLTQQTINRYIRIFVRQILGSKQILQKLYSQMIEIINSIFLKNQWIVKTSINVLNNNHDILFQIRSSDYQVNWSSSKKFHIYIGDIFLKDQWNKQISKLEKRMCIQGKVTTKLIEIYQK